MIFSFCFFLIFLCCCEYSVSFLAFSTTPRRYLTGLFIGRNNVFSQNQKSGGFFRDRPKSSFAREKLPFELPPPVIDENSVFVTDIDSRVHRNDLWNHMKKAGQIVSMRLLQKLNKGLSNEWSQGNSNKKSAIVEFSHPKQAQIAVKQLDKQEFFQSLLSVQEYQPGMEHTAVKTTKQKRRERENQRERDETDDRKDINHQEWRQRRSKENKNEHQEDKDEIRHKKKNELFLKKVVIVESLAPSMSWQDLRDLFRPFGGVSRADVVRMRKKSLFASTDAALSPESIVGIVEFQDPSDELSDIIQEVSNQYKTLKFRKLKSLEEFEDLTTNTSRGKRLHVTGLSERITSEELHQHFSTVGRVEKVRILHNLATDQYFGIIEFARKESVEKAINSLNGSLLGDCIFTVRQFVE
jgi:RNA recognition motif-containing protein